MLIHEKWNRNQNHVNEPVFKGQFTLNTTQCSTSLLCMRCGPVSSHLNSSVHFKASLSLLKLLEAMLSLFWALFFFVLMFHYLAKLDLYYAMRNVSSHLESYVHIESVEFKLLADMLSFLWAFFFFIRTSNYTTKLHVFKFGASWWMVKRNACIFGQMRHTLFWPQIYEVMLCMLPCNGWKYSLLRPFAGWYGKKQKLIKQCILQIYWSTNETYLCIPNCIKVF